VDRDVRAQSQQLFKCCLQRRPFGQGSHAAGYQCCVAHAAGAAALAVLC
jgi:hypothetical protein